MESAAKQDENPEPLPQTQQKRKQEDVSVDKQIIQNESADGRASGKKARFGRNVQKGGVAGGYMPNRGAGRGVLPDLNDHWDLLSQDLADEMLGPMPGTGSGPAKNYESGNQNQNPNANQGLGQDVQGGNFNQDGPGGQQQGGGQDGPGGPYHQQRDNRNRSGGGSRGGPGGGRGGDDFLIAQRLLNIAGPTLELPPVEPSAETKFSSRNRLYVGNLAKDLTEDELREIFKPYGEIDDIFTNLAKNFALLKVDYHSNAEKAKRALDGSMHKGRPLRVRFSPNSTILRVSNLTQYVTNELLHKGFEVFGPIERATITVDERGRSTGEGVVEFVRKASALACIRLCNEKCFFLTTSPRPCVVELMDVTDDSEGLPEKAINKNMPDFCQQRSIGPRFADRNSFEHEYGSRWKQLHYLFKTKQDALKRQLKMEEDKLESQVEYARYEQETDFLRQELRNREVYAQRKKLDWEMRQRQFEDMRKREEEAMLRFQGEMQIRREDDIRRRQQENPLYIQALHLNSLLDRQESFGGNGEINNSPFEVFKIRNSTMIGDNSVPEGGPNAQDSLAL